MNFSSCNALNPPKSLCMPVQRAEMKPCRQAIWHDDTPRIVFTLEVPGGIHFDKCRPNGFPQFVNSLAKLGRPFHQLVSRLVPNVISSLGGVAVFRSVL